MRENEVRCKSVGYVNKEGSIIKSSTWTTLRGNKEYVFIRRYENERIAASVEWVGKVVNVSNIPREYWKLYKVDVSNVILATEAGVDYWKKINDPTLTKEFGSEKEAMRYYQQMLADMNLLSVEEDYEGNEAIIEIDNRIHQPPMTELLVTFQRPKSDAASPSIFGSF